MNTANTEKMIYIDSTYFELWGCLGRMVVTMTSQFNPKVKLGTWRGEAPSEKALVITTGPDSGPVVLRSPGIGQYQNKSDPDDQNHSGSLNDTLINYILGKRVNSDSPVDEIQYSGIYFPNEASKAPFGWLIYTKDVSSEIFKEIDALWEKSGEQKCVYTGRLYGDVPKYDALRRLGVSKTGGMWSVTFSCNTIKESFTGVSDDQMVTLFKIISEYKYHSPSCEIEELVYKNFRDDQTSPSVSCS